MAYDEKELPQARLTTTDSGGHRIYVHPASVKGPFRKARDITHAVLMLIFLILPWIRIGGHQALLFDIARRKFAIFGLTFWAHDAPMVFFLIAGFVLTLAFLTALFGRVWCGWACPQTVFIDSVYRRIEKFIEGDWVARQRLDASPLNADKFLKRVAKWSAFVIVSIIFSHSFLAYFVGTEDLAHMIRQSPSENLGTFLFMAGFAATIAFDFGWFREQFCTIACPYGRFQSILMDKHSLTVRYDDNRGEPRQIKGQAPSDKPGDCIDCGKCVRVCPTGIDIRRGSQMECIGCTACIDACDDIMVRGGKPKGLIRYMGGTSPIRPRTLVYGSLLALITVGLVTTILSRREITATFARHASAPYQEAKDTDGSDIVLNHFKVDITNQSFHPYQVLFRAKDQPKVIFVVAGGFLNMSPGQKLSSDLFIKIPKALISSGRMATIIEMVDRESGVVLNTEDVNFVGPLR